MSVFADVHYCSYADIVGGSTKVQECADIIYGWSNWYTPAILGNSIVMWMFKTSYTLSELSK